jgi:hypothetical protein
MMNDLAIHQHPALWDITRALSLWGDGCHQEMAEQSLLECMPDYGFLDECFYGSWLTRTGYPIEFGFSSKDQRLRYITEVGGAHTPIENRLNLAMCLAQKFSGVALEHSIKEKIQDIQKQDKSALRYGAWLGIRHQEIQTDTKIYVELPNGLSTCCSLEGAEIFHEFAKGTLPAIWGYDLRSAHQELYCWADHWTISTLADVFRRIGWDGPYLAKLIFDLYGKACGRVFHKTLPGTTMGLSLSLDPYAQPVAISVYNYSDVLFGTDAQIVASLKKICQQTAFKIPNYEKISAPLENAHPEHPIYHGMFGFAVTQQGESHLHIGLTPPAEQLSQRISYPLNRL